jgi:hypothetical protein
MASCLAEMGAFGEGMATVEESMCIAQHTDQTYDLIVASTWLGRVYFRKGDFRRVITVIEAGLKLR